MTAPLLALRDVAVRFTAPGGGFGRPRAVHAVNQVSFDLAPGEVLGIVGESGCGKSTLGRAALGLIPPSAGSIVWRGRDLATIPAGERRRLRRETAIVFQDPLAALDPRMTIEQSVREPLDIFEPSLPRPEKRRRVIDALKRVGLGQEALASYPHQFSGGQCQRIGIARAIIAGPSLILCDEPVSALDVSVQAQIIRLLCELRDRDGAAMLFISHNLAVVRLLAERVMVLYLGRVMELAPHDCLFRAPLHPYTSALTAAVPVPDPVREKARPHAALTGDPPSALDPPAGCVFHTRCAHAIAQCREETPVLEPAGPGQMVACHRWRELASA